MFYINVVGQTMYATSANDHLVEGSQEFVTFCFQLSEEWNGLTVFAQFRQGNDAYNKYLDGENTVKLPTEIKEGTCTLMLYGSNDTVIGTSNYLIFRVDKNMLVSNAGSTQISQSLYEQLVTNVAGMKTRLDQIEKDGVSAERLSELIGEEIKKYMESGQPTGSDKTFASIKVIEHTDGRVTMVNTFTDGTSETIAIGAGATPGISYNGVAIPTEWVTEVSE